MLYQSTKLILIMMVGLVILNTGCMNKPAGVNTSESTTSTSVAFKFDGATSATNLSDTQIQIQWTKLNDTSLLTYRIFTLNADGSLSTLATVANSFSSYVVSNLTPGTLYSFVVRGADGAGNTDTNSNFVSAMTYAGVTSSSVLSGTSAFLSFPAAASAQNLKIYCASNGDGVFNLIATLPSLTSTYTLTNLTTNTPYTCKVNAVAPSGTEDSNASTTTFTPSSTPSLDLTFGGLSTATVLTAGNQAQLTWTLGTGANISNYRVSEVAANGVDLTTITTVPSTSSSVTLTGLSTLAFHTYVVHALSSTGVSDGNNVQKKIFTYTGVTSGSSTGTTTATINFPATGGNAEGVYIFCRPSWQSVYNSTPTLIINNTAATSANVTGLATGRTFICKVNPYLNGVSYENSATATFQTTSLSSTAYKGVVLVKAFGSAASAPQSPTSNEVTINWNYFGSYSLTSQSYWLVRAGIGNQIDMTTTTTCTNALTTSCRVCTITGAGPQSCVDSQVASSPQKYDYAVTKVSSDGMAEELPSSGDTPYRITVPVPPANMVLVHRDAVNFEMCSLMGKTPDPLNHQRCSYSGLGAIPYNSNPGNPPLSLSTSYYDLGYNLFVDRWEAACNWTLTGSGAPAGGSNGDVYYRNDNGDCYINASGTWRTMNDSSLTAAQRLAAYTIVPSTTNHKPPIVNIDQAKSYSTCNAVIDPDYGAKRLLRKREFIATSAWPTTVGEVGYLSDTSAATIEAGGDHSAGAATYRCNSDTHSGIANAAFNGADYELSRNATAGPDSFTIGSNGTKNCVSRFGAQDLVGNVWEWTSDQLNTCSSGTHSCMGGNSTLDSGNTDMNNFAFDGTQGHGGGTSNVTDWLFETTPLTLGGFTYNTNYFSPPLGLPLATNDGGNAMQVGTAMTSTKLHGDKFWLLTDNGNGTPARGLVVGGHWNVGSDGGRWSSYFVYAPASTNGYVGFRCALPAE